ncbi:MAG: integrase core domain-containing protein [Chitinophagales bacterium]
MKRCGCYISRRESVQSNAYGERVNGIIKKKYISAWEVSDFKALKRKFKQVIKHYNEQRLH